MVEFRYGIPRKAGLSLEKVLKELVKEVKGIKTGFDEFRTEVREIKAEFNEFRTEVREIKSEFNELKIEVKEMRTEVADLKTEVKGIKTEVADIKTEVKEIKTEVKIHSIKFEKIEPLIEETNQIVKALESAKDIHRAKLDSQGHRITKIEGTLKAIKKAL